MRIPTRHFAVVVALLCSFLLSPATSLAQTGTNDWSKLNSVGNGTRLSVKLKDGKKMEGTLDAVSDTSISLTVRNARKDVRRADVASVHELSKKSAGKATLIGLGVGAGAGAVIGLAGDASNDAGGFETLDNAAAGAVAIAGAGVGALVGFLFGKSGNKKVLLYESK